MKLHAILPAVAALGITAANGCLLERELAAEREFVQQGTRRWSGRPSQSYRSEDAAVREARRRTSKAFPIGSGDRFDNGTVAPVGLGVSDRNLKSILSVDEVPSALAGLAAEYPDDVKLWQSNRTTAEGRAFHGAQILPGEVADPRVFIMSGIHARERGGPDNVIYFVADLLAARKSGSGLTYGDKEFSAEDVTTALSAGLVILPLVNPDGVAYDQETDLCWRKNRNTDASSSGDGDDVGVDLNRNFDFVWDYTVAFNQDADISSAASDDPSSEIYHGASAMSEPETKAVADVFDTYTGLSWFVDLHSYGPTILYGWGDDDVGTEDPSQNFTNRAFDGLRGFTGDDPADSEYKEYLTPDDLAAEEDGCRQMATSMNAAGLVEYDVTPAVYLYPTSGASNDWAMGRYYGRQQCGAGRVFGLTIEFGGPSDADSFCPFYPSDREYHNSIRQIGAAFTELLINAAGDAGKPLYYECAGQDDAGDDSGSSDDADDDSSGGAAPTQNPSDGVADGNGTTPDQDNGASRRHRILFW
jgi:murein tripeptide amidase MpaA